MRHMDLHDTAELPIVVDEPGENGEHPFWHYHTQRMLREHDNRKHNTLKQTHGKNGVPELPAISEE